MTTRLTILGGSSPYTVALIDALAGVPESLLDTTVMLHGRNADHLRAVQRYARAKLAGLVAHVESTRCVEQALEGASVVVHQVRYGGLEARADDEAFAEAFGIAADETLGPAAVRAALRMAPAVARLADVLRTRCPDAWVVNLANPLGISTSLLCAAGIRAFGVCELPAVTVQLAASILDVPFASLEWRYHGLNHRGFVHDLRRGGVDVLPDLLARLGDRTINGISRDVIEELDAIPLKYFPLVRSARRPSGRRAAFLTELGQRIFRELQASPHASPPSLGRRDLRWYPEAVVPAIVAVTSTAPRRLVVDLPDEDGVVVEAHADVCASGVRRVPAGAPGRRVAAWLDVFMAHERAFLTAVATPSLDTLTAALAADPLLVSVDVKPLASALWRYARQEFPSCVVT